MTPCAAKAGPAVAEEKLPEGEFGRLSSCGTAGGARNARFWQSKTSRIASACRTREAGRIRIRAWSAKLHQPRAPIAEADPVGHLHAKVQTSPTCPLTENETCALTLPNIAAVAVALAMDAFAVAIAAGVKLGEVDLRQTFRLAWHFGFFQAAMPVIGWAAGLTIRSQIEQYDHWVASALLLFVAQGMFRGAFKDKASRTSQDPTKGATMVMLSVATSLDALAVGLSLSVIKASIWIPALTIGLVAALFTAVGIHLGSRVSRAGLVRRYADFTGALILSAIAFNILRVHGALGG